MSLSHNGYTYLGHATDSVIVAGSVPDLQMQRFQFFGLQGEAHVIGESSGVDLSCEFTLQGYNTHALLMSDVGALAGKVGKLTGTLTQTIGGNSNTYPKCTFLGYVASEPPFLDGSGVNGWVSHGRLFWRQRA